MPEIEFTPEQKAQLAQQLKRWLDSELGIDIGQFDAEFLLNYISENLGAHYYNQGLLDARAVFQGKLDLIDEDIYALEKTPGD